jgi:hypothetical protein
MELVCYIGLCFKRKVEDKEEEGRVEKEWHFNIK